MRRSAFANRLLRPVQPVEQVSLREDLRLRRVEILRLAVAEHAAAESDDVPARIGDREHEPVAEARPRLRPVLAHHEQSRRESAARRRTRARRAPRASRRDRAARSRARTDRRASREIPRDCEVVARDSPARRFPELLCERTRGGARSPPTAARARRARRCAADVSRTSTPAFAPTHFTASTKSRPRCFCAKREDVARLAADEALVSAARRDGEVVVLAVMKRTRARESCCRRA